MSSRRTAQKKSEPVEEVHAPAPVVEAAPVEVAAVEEAVESYESLATSFREDMSSLVALVKKLNSTVKTMEKQHAREVKAGGKSKRSAPKKDRAPSGFAKATPVPEQLRKFLGLAADIELPRTEVAKQIYSYVREKDLRDKDDRRIIHPDAPLQKLFGLKKDETLDFKNFQKQLSRHYPKPVGKVEAAPVVEAVVEEAAPVVEAPKRRSRAAGATA